MLSDLVTELARLQALMNNLKSARREVDAKSFRNQIEGGKLQAAMLTGALNDRFPFLPTILPGETSEPNPDGSVSKDGSPQAQPLVMLVDLFG
jgi:hypothetical protein